MIAAFIAGVVLATTLLLTGNALYLHNMDYFVAAAMIAIIGSALAASLVDQ